MASPADGLPKPRSRFAIQTIKALPLGWSVDGDGINTGIRSGSNHSPLRNVTLSGSTPSGRRLGRGEAAVPFKNRPSGVAGCHQESVRCCASVPPMKTSEPLRQSQSASAWFRAEPWFQEIALTPAAF